MKLTYLGTAASEGFPAVFCNCEFCNNARRLGGKNIRTRSQALINDDMLIDFPPDSYFHFVTNNIEADKIKYLLITHAHSDHFYADDLNLRRGVYAQNMREPILNMFCSKSVYEKLGRIPEGIDVTVVKPFDNISVEKYNIVALPARHTKEESEPLNYIVSADKTILYAHDTGYFFDETFDYIKENKIRFDLVSLDCTHVDNITSDTGRHMGFDNVSRVIKRLRSIDALDENSKCYVNHFSHNGNPLHERVCDLAAKIGCKAAYDGLSVDI